MGSAPVAPTGAGPPPSALASVRSVVERAQFVFCRLQPPALRGGELLAGAVDVEGQHRHGRAKRTALAPVAALGRALQRARDAPRIGLLEDVALQIERIAAAGHRL